MMRRSQAFHKFEWTDRTVDKLLAMVRAGYTPREAAAKLGITRNAVIGKARRLGHPFGSKPEMRVIEPEPIVEPEPVPIPRADPDFPRRCAMPGCRGTKQHNARGYCATHEAEYLNGQRRNRADMREVAVGPVMSAAV